MHSFDSWQNALPEEDTIVAVTLALAPLAALAAANVLPSNLLPLFVKASTASASSFGTKKSIIFEAN